MSLPKRLGFALSRTEVDGHPRRAARFHCKHCAASVDIPIRNGNTLSPDHVAKIAARDHGWIADAENASLARCPACQIRRRRPEPPAEVTPSVEQMMPAEKITPIKPVAAPAVVVLTTDQRVTVRSYLDKHFDDSIGSYLDGMSDQRIAEMMDVPRICIEQLREAAYGPIRVNPAVAAILADVAALRRDLDEQQTALQQTRKRLDTMEAALPALAAQP